MSCNGSPSLWREADETGIPTGVAVFFGKCRRRPPAVPVSGTNSAGEGTGGTQYRIAAKKDGHTHSDLGVTLDCGDDLIAPSLGTPGDGWGEGFLRAPQSPHPIPLPEYRAREPENSRHDYELHPRPSLRDSPLESDRSCVLGRDVSRGQGLSCARKRPRLETIPGFNHVVTGQTHFTGAGIHSCRAAFSGGWYEVDQVDDVGGLGLPSGAGASRNNRPIRPNPPLTTNRRNSACASRFRPTTTNRTSLSSATAIRTKKETTAQHGHRAATDRSTCQTGHARRARTRPPQGNVSRR